MNLLRIREYLITIILALAALAILIGGGIALSSWQSEQPSACNVASVKLFGPLVYYPNEYSNGRADPSSVDQSAAEDIRAQIEAADADPSIKAILLQVDSPGGDPVAGEDVMAALEHASKPTVALVGDLGTSAAYWAMTGAGTIFASANSSLGDIGVTQSYLQETKQDQQNGLQFVSLTAGQYKDMGNPSAPLTPAEKALFQRDLDITYNNFIADVAANRHLAVDKVKALADGSSMLGEMALQDGLIDRIGTIYDAKEFLQKKINSPVTICQ